MHQPWTPEFAKQRHPLLAFFAGRPITVTVLLVATAVLGLISLRLMPIELFPGGLENRSLSVEVPFSRGGNTVSPMTVERELTLIVEAELSTIPGIKELWATSSRTEADFNLEFDGNRDMDDAYAEVMAAVERARLRLPADTGRVRVWRRGMSSANFPVAFLNFSWEDGTPDPWLTLEKVAQPFLENIEGVAGVTFWGGQQKYIVVDFDPDKTRTYGVDLSQLLSRLRSDNFRQPAGKVAADETTGPGREVYLVADSMFQSLADIENLPVRPGLQLSQLTRHGTKPDGTAHRGVYETYSVSNYVRTNGRRGMSGQIHQSGDANTVEVGRRVEAAIAELSQRPEMNGFTILVPFNQGRAIEESIANLMDTLLWGGVLAFLVLLLFLKSWRLSLVIALAIPLCMTLTLAVMYFAGQTINLLALMGFTLAAGMLLDNAIVVAENVYRRHAHGELPVAAAIRGAGEVGLALVLATSTTVIVFITVIFMAGEPFLSFVMGKIGLPVCVSLGFSIVIALAVVPMTMNTAGLLKTTQTSRIRRRFVILRRTLVRRLRRGGAAAMSALAGLGLWELMALFAGRNRRGLPGTPIVDALGRQYERAVRGMMSLRMLIAPIALGLTALAVILLPGALEKTDQNQGNRDRIQLNVRFPRNSDITVVKRALLVSNVEPGSAAERAGVQLGDYVLAYNSRPVGSEADLHRLAQSGTPGVKVPMDLARGSMTGTLEIETGPSGISGVMEDTQPLRDAIWQTYVFEVEGILQGVPGADVRRRAAMESQGLAEEDALKRFGRSPQEAREFFGIDTLSASFSERRANFWIYIDPERVDQADEFYKRITAAMPERAGLRTSGEFQGGSAASSEVSVRLSGPDTERLLMLAEEFALRLEGVPGLEGIRVDSEEGMEEVTLAVERERASAFGVNPASISQVLGFQLGGTTLRDFQRQDVMLPLRVRFAPPSDAQGNLREPVLEDASEARIPTSAGGSVPTRSVTSSSGLARAGMGEIRRRNRQTSLRIVGTTSSEDLERIRSQVNMALEGVQLPPGYTRELSGRFSDFGARFSDLRTTLMWSGLLVFLVMCFLFESFLKPMCILAVSVPSALMGGFGTLWVTGTPFDVITGLGLMVLVGVVVNNGIVMVDLVNRLRAEGMEREAAVFAACRQRLRPILLTTLTTAFGLIPMAVGDANFVGTPYFPMGRLVLGGILVSMVYTLLLVPMAYTIVDDIGLAAKTWLSTAFAPRAKGGGVSASASAE